MENVDRREDTDLSRPEHTGTAPDVDLVLRLLPILSLISPRGWRPQPRSTLRRARARQRVMRTKHAGRPSMALRMLAGGTEADLTFGTGMPESFEKRSVSGDPPCSHGAGSRSLLHER